MEVPIVKRWIDSEEWYPVYELRRNHSGYSTEVQIPEDLVQRYAAAYKEFKAVQSILKGLYES